MLFPAIIVPPVRQCGQGCKLDGVGFGRAAHHLRPDKKARLKALGRRAVAVVVTPIIGVHKDVGAILLLGIDAVASATSRFLYLGRPQARATKRAPLRGPILRS
jgi:hypothetical protein